MPGTALSEAMLRRHRGGRDKARDRQADERGLQRRPGEALLASALNEAVLRRAPLANWPLD